MNGKFVIQRIKISKYVQNHQKYLEKHCLNISHRFVCRWKGTVLGQ